MDEKTQNNVEVKPKHKGGRPRKTEADRSREAIEKANREIEKMLAIETDAMPKEKRKVRATPLEIRKAMLETVEAKKQPKVESLEELIDRIDKYFLRCADKGIYPTQEEMYGYTGYSQWTIYQWLSGIKNPPFGEKTKEVLRNARDYLMIFDAKMVVDGKLDFLTYCFRAKNFYGMSDKQELVVTPNNPLGDEKTQKELEEHYIKALYTVVDEKKE